MQVDRGRTFSMMQLHWPALLPDCSMHATVPAPHWLQYVDPYTVRSKAETSEQCCASPHWLDEAHTSWLSGVTAHRHCWSSESQPYCIWPCILGAGHREHRSHLPESSQQVLTSVQEKRELSPSEGRALAQHRVGVSAWSFRGRLPGSVRLKLGHVHGWYVWLTL